MKRMKKTNRTNIGGQAVLEGVMMRGSTSMCTSVRDQDGKIRVETERLKPLKDKPFIFRVPVIRGMINFFSSMVSGSRVLMRSAEVYGESEPTKFEKWLSKTFKVDLMSVVTTISLFLGLALAVFLFIWLPQFLTGLMAKPLNLSATSVWFNLIEGGIKILIFLGYILLTSLLKDIRRTYMYHGAEHKTINCYEYGMPLTVENVKKCTRVHDRCGTTFIFFVMFVSIIVFSIVNSFVQAERIYRVLLKLALLPVVAGLSYELLKALSKTDSVLVLPLKAPGMLLQRITTSEPSDDMIEVAINSFNTVLKMEEDLTIKPEKFVTAMASDKLLEEVKSILKEGGVCDQADAEWIVSVSANMKRSEVIASKKTLSPSIVEKARRYAKERATSRPLWYVIGDTEFYGYTVKVDERALIPRPETEEVVLKALSYINENSRVLDLCTGSGAIAIAVKKEKNCLVSASDVSKDALTLAKENASLNNIEIDFIESNLFENIEEKFDVIISNPPYIKTSDIDKLQKEIGFEPMLALDGGEDGLAFYRLIARDFEKHLNQNGKLVLECGEGESKDIVKIFGAYKTAVFNDLNGKDRIIVVEL